jgi:hypothetical protein
MDKKNTNDITYLMEFDIINLNENNDLDKIITIPES